VTFGAVSMRSPQMCIDGRFVPGATHLPVVDAGGRCVLRLPRASEPQVVQAVNGAVAAAASWRATPGVQRSRLLTALLWQFEAAWPQLHESMSDDPVEAEAELEQARAMLVGWAGWADKWADQWPEPVEPLGVVAILAPAHGLHAWLQPLLTALVAGNAVVFVDGGMPLFAERVAQLMVCAGWPAGLVQVLMGDRFAVAGHICRCGDVAAVAADRADDALWTTLTGSVADKSLIALPGCESVDDPLAPWLALPFCRVRTRS
jgi:acyl-CoA reductase-like NAD-dependent aldehyde dehydrogenase